MRFIYPYVVILVCLSCNLFENTELGLILANLASSSINLNFLMNHRKFGQISLISPIKTICIIDPGSKITFPFQLLDDFLGGKCHVIFLLCSEVKIKFSVLL